MTERGGQGEERKGFFEMVRKANAPPPPEHSTLFRIATLVAVLSGVFACSAVGELATSSALLASVAIAAGMTFSSLTRRRPWQWVKILLAVAVMGVFVNFVAHIFGVAHTGELSSIEVPLAGLFVWVQVVHAFDVPARRDLLFSVAAAAALLTVAGAQAQSSGFLAFVGVWLCSSVVALACSWRSMAGGEGHLRVFGLAGATILVLAVAVVLEAVLPPPRTSQEITLPASFTRFLALPSGGGLTQGGANPTEPAQAGKASSNIGVGGYAGMSGPLDTALRGVLGNQVVMKVRADRPGYFLGLTYNQWDGQSWTNLKPCKIDLSGSGSPFTVPMVGAAGGTPFGQTEILQTGSSNVQTFYVEQPLPNVLFATSIPAEVYFPAHTMAFGLCDNSMRSTIAMTPGTVYTVVSQDNEESPKQLAGIPATVFDNTLLADEFKSDLQLPSSPDPYKRVAALALSIVSAAHATSLVGEVQALENWMGTHTQYSTDIPPLLPGQDAVNEFLFGSRLGYCEQISTALAVMLRTLGVPAREATGYVPGSFDPLSDLYTIQAKDAHAWVQVYFPGAGWQNFDPTSYVPLSPADPGAVLLSDLGRTLGGLPWWPIGTVALLAAAVYGRHVALRRRRARPPTWAGRLALAFEKVGRRAGIARRQSETFIEYLRRLNAASGGTAGLRRVADIVTRAAYAGLEPTTAEQAEAESVVAVLRSDLRHYRPNRTAQSPRRSSRAARAAAGVS